MAFYNISIRDFGNGKKQIRLFSRPVQDDSTDFDLDLDFDVLASGEFCFDDAGSDSDVAGSATDPDQEHSDYESYRRSKQAVYDIARSNDWEWFFTLTFNPALVDSFNYEEVTAKLSKWLNNLKSRCSSDLRYLLVPEKHKSGRFHFHGLFSNLDPALLVDSGHRDRSGRIVYNLGSYKLGFSTVTAVTATDTAVGYLMKYVSKDLCSVTKYKKRYWCSRNLNRPQITTLLYNGDLLTKIRTFSDGCVWSKTASSPFNKVIYLEIDENKIGES